MEKFPVLGKMEKHHSCLVTRAVIDYFLEFHPEAVPRLLEGLGPEIAALPDPLGFLTEINNWVSSEVVIQMFANAKAITGDEDIVYKIGFESSIRKRFSYIQRIILFAFKNPRRTLQRMQAINDKFNRNKRIELVHTTANTAIFRLHWFRHIPATKDFCRFNQGVYAGLPVVWNLPPGEIWETKCYFEGDDYCEFHSRWELIPLRRRLLRIFVPWRALKLTIEEMEQDKEKLRQKFDELHNLYLELERKNVELQRANIKLRENQELLRQSLAEVKSLNLRLEEANEDLERANLLLKEKINQLECLQETGTTILSIIKPEDLFQVTLRMLTNFGRMDRAGIFLLDDKSQTLRFAHAVGVPAELLPKLQDYQVPLHKVDNLIARVAMTGKAARIEDVNQSKLNRSNPILQLFQPKSFIAAPLTVRSKVIGVLLADRLSADHRINESDEDFIVSFANQIAIALDNANLFRQKELSERRYRELFENAHTGIWVLNEVGVIEAVNRRMEEICGQDGLAGHHVYDLFDPSNQKQLREILAQNREGQAAQKELEIISAKRGAVAVLMSSVPLFDDRGRYLGSFAMFSDISEMKAMEKQLFQVQKLEAIGTLAGGIAHDFNNVLMAIMAYTEGAMQEVPEDSTLYLRLQRVLQSTRRASDLVKQILTFSRPQEYERKPIRLSTVVSESLKMLRATLPSTIIIQSQIDTEIGSILGDATQMHQVLLNLCTNAAHAMRDKGGVLRLKLEQIYLTGERKGEWKEAAPGAYIRLEVADTGTGMEPQVLERIFEPFFTTKKPGEGTGMGLSVVHGIVRAHGGHIHVTSTLGRGTTFQILFPVYQAAERGEIAAETQEVAKLPLGRERILFVDDETTVTEIVKLMLERLGYEVVAKSSSLEALELIQTEPERFDLIIADQTMPHITGVALANEVSRIRPDLPVILCTGMIDHLKLEQEQPAGIRKILTKPVSLHDLARAIRQTLDQEQVSYH